LTTTPPQLAFDTLPVSPYPAPPRRIGALWRRFVAFLIDGIVIAFIGSVLGYIFFALFMDLGPAGCLVGYFVGMFYFAIPESFFGNGQSLGKRLLLLQVVNRKGELLSIEQSIIRYTVFAVPWFLSGISLNISRTSWAVFLLVALAIFGIGGASLYLMVFNRNTRQGVHDLVVGGYVAESRKNGPITAQRIWKLHWLVAAAIVVLAIAGGIEMQRLRVQGTIPQLLTDIRQVELLPGVQSASILRIATHDHGNKDISLVVKVRCNVSNSDQEALANQVADSVITIDPTIDQYSLLRIVLIRGYDIGIARSSFSQSYADTPAHWRQEFFLVPPQMPSH
jgi:uncharacterized RDD family membrane protein YckC